MGYTDEDIWARFYDHIGPGIEGDVAFYTGLAREAAGPILELGCGTGRVLFAVAGATDQRVTGLDLSASMLAVCRDRLAAQPAAVRERVQVVSGDMTDFTVDEPAALVLIPYRAFHHLLTVEDQEACLACIRRSLAPGGRVCINCFDPQYHLLEDARLSLASPSMPRVDFLDDATGHTVHVETRFCEFDADAQTLGELWQLTEFAGETVIGEYEIMLRIRYGFRYEMEYLFRRAGFEIEALYGDFAPGPFRYGAEQIWLLS